MARQAKGRSNCRCKQKKSFDWPRVTPLYVEKLVTLPPTKRSNDVELISKKIPRLVIKASAISKCLCIGFLFNEL